MLFTVGAAFSIYDGVHKILNPEAVALAAGSPSIVLGRCPRCWRAFSLRTGISEANQVRGDRNWGTFIRRTKAPELPVVLLEDMAALIGLAFAFAGVALSVLTGNGRWDGAGSLAIGLLLATAAAILAVEMKSLLIGEAASPEMQRMIIAALEDGPEVVRVIHMRTVHISPDSVLVAAKIAVRRERHRRPDHGGHRRRRTPGARRRPHRHDHLPGAGHLPPARGRPGRPFHPRRPAQPLLPPEPRPAGPGPSPSPSPANPSPSPSPSPEDPSVP